ncbi:DUF7500 family protein [Haloarchaeobius sp. DFWS5]|uniref:DUF7500 family protein n=1 Tax=Haloarchaeobius sp. DFWS5 TaxID=3446114 RepID=UPI003EC09A2D
MNERTKHADSTADGVLSPEDLALDEDHVRSLDEHRQVIAAGDGPSANSHGGTPRMPDIDVATIPDATDTDGDGATATTGSPQPAAALADHSAPYGVDIAVKTDDAITHETIHSSDIREVFERLLRWYARQLDDELPPEETLAILLDASGLEL